MNMKIMWNRYLLRTVSSVQSTYRSREAPRLGGAQHWFKNNIHVYTTRSPSNYRKLHSYGKFSELHSIVDWKAFQSSFSLNILLCTWFLSKTDRITLDYIPKIFVPRIFYNIIFQLVLVSNKCYTSQLCVLPFFCMLFCCC